MKKKRTSRYHALLAGYAIITIPIYTLLFATKESPFNYTLSQIGNFFDWDHRRDFIIWGIITGASYSYYLGYLFHRTYFQNKKGRLWLILSNMFLVLTVITPSIKDVFPFFTKLHLLFSILFAISLVLSTTFFIEYLGQINAEISARSTTWGIVIVGGSVVSLVIFGKTGIFELFFLITFSIFYLVLGVWLRNDEKIRDFVSNMRSNAEHSIDAFRHKNQ